MNEVAVFAFGRTQSQRCPNKMLRSFADTTLTDIVLSKLARCSYPAFFAGFEPEFSERCAAHGVRFVQRDERSATVDEPILEILSFLRTVEFDHFLIVNACLPLLSLETIETFLEDCLGHDRAPAFGVVRRHNHFIDLDHRPLNFDLDMKTINTKTVAPVLEFPHALYFFERAYFLENGAYWDWRTVRFIELPDRHEVIDIDTEGDFVLAEAMWKTGYLKDKI